MSNDVEHLKEIMELKFANSEKALKLEATEIARRLDILNGEAERLRTIQATYYPRELAEANFKEVNKSISALQKIIYTGLGALAVIQLLIQIVPKFL